MSVDDSEEGEVVAKKRPRFLRKNWNAMNDLGGKENEENL